MSERRFDLLVAGELNPDVIVASEDLEPEFGQVERLVDRGVLTIGASGAIVACGAAHLGLRTAYVGVVGDDSSGSFMLVELRRRGVDVDWCRTDPERPTGLTVILSRGDDRAVLTSPGAMSALTAADVSTEMLTATEHLHASSPYLQAGLLPGLGELFARAHGAGASTSLDPGWDPSGRFGASLDAALEHTDVFLPNAAEACRLANTDDPAEALAALAARIGTVAVKLGAEGAIARRGEETASAAAPSVDSVDATGAGDSFAAGFLRGLRSGEGLDEALRLAVACGSLSTRGLGGVAAQPQLEQAVAVARTLAIEAGSR
jgi:sugar/nucleoside kinase (ribokinase family)